MPRPAVTPPYDPAAWSALVNACRQPRNSYRWALLVPGAVALDGLPGAGAGGRWFLLPVGALLLRREPGTLAGLHDLEAAPLRLGPFLLRRMQPVTPEAAQRRARLRVVRAARAELRGRRVPGVVAVPNEGRPVRHGARLVLSVSADFVRERCRQARASGLRATGGKGARFVPEFLANGLNRMTAELERVAEFAWVDVGTLRRWDKVSSGVMLAALTRSGWKGSAARQWVGRHVRPWQRSRPSASSGRAAAARPARA